MNTEENKDSNAREPIKCPICGSMHLAFTEEHRTSLGRIIKPIAIVLYFVILFFLFPAENTFENFFMTVYNIYRNGYLTFTIFWFLFYLIIKGIIWGTERKSHAKAICRDCGHLWLLD